MTERRGWEHSEDSLSYMTALEALQMIAGEVQCVDNLMSNADIAKIALAEMRKATVDADHNARRDPVVTEDTTNASDFYRSQTVDWLFAEHARLVTKKFERLPPFLSEMDDLRLACVRFKLDLYEMDQHYAKQPSPVPASPASAGTADVEWRVSDAVLKRLAATAECQLSNEFWSEQAEAMLDLRDARAALARRPAGKWRDIASAPKNAPILICGGTVKYAAGINDYLPFEEVAVAWWKSAAIDGWSSGEYDGDDVWHKPLFWTPLPAPPSNEGGRS